MKNIFEVGDKVIFINNYGAIFPGKTVAKVEVGSGLFESRYGVEPTDTPWILKREWQLFRESELRQLKDAILESCVSSLPREHILVVSVVYHVSSKNKYAHVRQVKRDLGLGSLGVVKENEKEGRYAKDYVSVAVCCMSEIDRENILRDKLGI